MAKLSDRSTIMGNYPERNPQEAALMIWLRVLVATRWTAIPMVIIATLIATKVFHISFLTLPVYLICAFIAAYNLLLLLQSRNLEKRSTRPLADTIRGYGTIHIVLDLVTLTVQESSIYL